MSAQAGDILRGGAGAGALPGNRTIGGSRSVNAARTSANAGDALARTTKALQSIQAMQKAARNLSIKGPNNLGNSPIQPGIRLPNVPNGLTTGGLKVSPNVPSTLPTGGVPGLWVGAQLPRQTESNGKTIVTIKQEQSKALLTWESFNIGKETTLKFDQSAGGSDKNKWIAFNKVEDPTGVPSQILGSIEAPGQVYVINRNGIIFGGSSQVNTRGFVASTLPINDNLVQQGLLNNPDAQFLFSALPVPGGSDGTPAFIPTISDPSFQLALGSTTYRLEEPLAINASSNPLQAPIFSIRAPDGSSTILTEETDYTLSLDPVTKRATANFTSEGLAKIGSTQVKVTYAPAVVPTGDITVQAGAVLRTPVSADGNGGRVMLVGSKVTNAGKISTPSGQTIMAAGQQVAVAAHASNDPSLRGLDVYVGAAGGKSGTVTNSGLIQSYTGSVSLGGKTINQFGVIDSSTSVNLNGRIDIKASFGAVANPNFDNKDGVGAGGPAFFYQNTGIVTLGTESVTRILPDYLSERTVPGTSLPETSRIEMEGLAIHFRPRAMMLAPNGDVNIRAGVWPYKDADGDGTVLNADGTLYANPIRFVLNGEQKFLFSEGQIYLDQSAFINVAGSTNVFVPLTQSILNVEFRSSEFADSPLQREGMLSGIPLAVDIRRTGVVDGRFWMGTPLGDVTGLAGLIERNVAQLTASGGNVTLRAGESIVVNDGATIDVSGGSYQHEGGMIKTTRLIQSGRLLDIEDARPGQLYDGVFTGDFTQASARWGVSETFKTPLISGEHYEEGYIQAAPGGALAITAPSMAIDGELRGLTVQDSRDRSIVEHSRLSLDFSGEKLFDFASTPYFLPTSPTPPDVSFSKTSNQVSVPEFKLVDGLPAALPAERVASFALSPVLLEEQGFGHLTITNTDGNITVPEKTRLVAAERGSITLDGANVTIGSNISIPGGSLSFSTHNISPAFAAQYAVVNPAGTVPVLEPNEGRGLFRLLPGVTLSTAGLIVDDRPGAVAPLSQPLVIDGGKISIASYSAILANESQINVSGGVAVDTRSVVKYGNGGSISILAGKDPSAAGVIGGELQLGSKLTGYSGATGGSLSIQASTIQIGGTPDDPNTLILQPDFFRKGGFSTYALAGIGAPTASSTEGDELTAYVPGIKIAAGVRLAPVVEGWFADLTPDSGATGVSLQRTLNPVGLRNAVSLGFTSLGSDDSFTTGVLEVRGDLVMGSGATIIADPGSKVAFKGQTVTLLGSVFAPGGSISITGANRFPLPQELAQNEIFATPTVHIGAEVTLSTVGAAVVIPDAFGRRRGTLYPGGTIAIAGNILAEAGAILDVSGSSGVFDYHTSALGLLESPIVPLNSGLTGPLWSLQSVAVPVHSSGGLIDLQGSQMLLSDATLLGMPGGSTATGGTLSVFSGRFYRVGAPQTSADINLVVTQGGKTIASSNQDPGVGIAVLGSDGLPISGMGYFSANRFAAGGFASLDLGAKFIDGGTLSYGGNVEFRGPVSISAAGSLRVAAGGLIQTDSAVKLSGSYVSLGQAFRAPLHPDDPVLPFFTKFDGFATSEHNLSPTFGSGSLTVQAQLIDVGTLVLQNVGHAQLIANDGDIRGNGTLSMAGEITMRAGQVYPTTLGEFNVFAHDAIDGDGSVRQAGTINVERSGRVSAPISIGGNLRLFASEINQGGVLRAPLGSITLGWDGTDYDLSDADLDTPLDPIAKSTAAVPVADRVTLRGGSMTSVSSIGIIAPFGLSPDGTTWIDPRGVNVTVGGLPEKRVVVSGDNVVKKGGSTIDLRGGGDLLAFRWVPGSGGSVDILGTATTTWSTDAQYSAGDLVTFGGRTWSARVSHSGIQPTPSLYWTLVPDSYAVVPGYQARFAPYAPFNTGSNADFLGGDPGFIGGTLKIGDQIYLDGIPGLDGGVYTLLPRRYALLPGAFLVTPKSGMPLGTLTLPDGSSYSSGFAFNQFSLPGQFAELQARYEVAPSDVMRDRAGYDNYLGNAFFTEAASRLRVKGPQALPMDSGYFGMHGNSAISIGGKVLTGHPFPGNGATIDLSSFGEIAVVGGSGTGPTGATAVIRTSVLNSWNADSLIIGGLRRETANGTVVDVRTESLVLDNPEAKLTGPDITLASAGVLTVTDGSSVKSTGSLSGRAVPLTIAGDGALLRVSADSRASVNRSNLTSATDPLLTIGADVQIGGRSVILDSTHGTSVDPTVGLNTKALTLGSGQISIMLDGTAPDLTGSMVEPHLVLAGDLLADVQQVRSVTLSSYRTIDLYGAGELGSETLRNLSLFASGLRGYNQGEGTALIRVDSVTLANPSNVAAVALPGNISGTLQFEANTLQLGANTFSASGYERVNVNAAGGVLGQSNDGVRGTFSTPGDLTITAPVITGLRGSTHEIVAGGNLVLQADEGASAVQGGLGASFAFTGSTIVADGNVILPSGQISLRALTGDLTVGGTLDVSGTRRDFYDLIRFTDAGSISLTSDLGNVTLLPGGRVSAEGAEGGGNAGTVAVKASNGAFILNNSTLLGSASTDERAGTFTLDTGSLTSFADLADALNDGGFFEERNLRVRTGDITIDGTTTSRKFIVSADTGDIRVTGTVNASGRTGGKIALMAGGDLVLEAGSELNVHAREFSSAGKGGEIRLEAGAAVNGIANQNAILDLQLGAMLDLGVDAFKAGDYTTVGSSAFRGQFTGTLHLRAPRTSGNTDVAVNTIGATIANASSILVEGYEIVDLTNAGGLITGGRTNSASLPGANTVQGAVYASANAFLSTANHDAMMARLLGSDLQNLAGSLVLAPGVEIINTNGDLILGAPNSTSLAGDWSLADFRFGPKGSPGVLTLRASGDVVFNNALSDGFAHVNPTDANGRSMLWLGQLLPIDTDLPINTQSWSFRIAAGSDLGAADFRAVLRTEQLAPDKGSIIVGEYYVSVPNSTTSGANAGVGSNGLTANSIRIGSTGTRYEVIRTGTGDIDINAGRNLQLSNQFATVYTAGVRLPDPTNVYGTNDFVLPIVSRTPAFPNQGGLGAYQQLYPAQWSMAGGDVSLAAQGDIGRFTRVNGEIVPDSSLQLPNNWLNRRGFVDPLTGLFAAAGVNDPPISSQRVDDLSASTAWWVDFSNFFEGFGALGGGDVTLIAGHDLVNADAAIATNARMSGRDANGENVAPDPARLLELGGGDLVAHAGSDIDAGVYYVERGSGELSAGGSIVTNETRSPSVGDLTGAVPLDPLTWLPTTLFVGKSQFEVSARGDVLIGPVSNTFLLPQGLNNKFWYKTYFNTFSGDAGASISSFGGSVTHRLAVTLDGGSLAQPILGAWLKNVNQFTGSTSNASYYQPWIRLAELSLDREGYDPVFTLTAPTIESTAFAGDVSIVGAMTLFPASKGALELAASGNIVGLNPSGQGFSGDTTPATVWTSATINISDANPAMVPGVVSPLAYSSFVGLSLNASRASNVDLYQSVSQMFRETGSYTGVNGAFDVQQALHSPGPLHSGDPDPVKVYAASGDITGLTLFSPKATQIIADNDITDISFYIQNVAPTDISIVSAGRDIIPFNENASVRTLASDLSQGNTVGDAQRPTVAGTSTNAAAGDIQINGPGVIEILAGRNLDLGTGSNFTDGTGVGITSVGNSRNPYLPFDGADIIAMAGVSGSGGRGPAIGLSGSSLDFAGFIEEYLANGPESPSSYLQRLGRGFEFDELNDEQQAIVALESFYEILRNAGRSAGASPDPASTDSGSGESEVASTEAASTAATAGTTSGYDDGFAAIETLFGADKPASEINTRARDVRTVTGGAISLASVGGGLTMASDIFGNPLTPPGIVTEYGGSISSFTDGSVSIGQARIFTLRGGDINIWSSNGDIAAGNAPKTVVTAPPTRVIVDADSGAVETDLGGLATGGGIGVLASVEGVPPGNVDLIAPNGAVDAGDAGIRASGNLNIAATTVLNAGNIQVAGSSSGVPAPAPVAAPNLGALTAGSSTAGAAAAAATQMAQTTKEEEDEEKDEGSIIVVEVIGYGGGEG